MYTEDRCAIAEVRTNSPRAPSTCLFSAGIIFEHAAKDIFTWTAHCRNTRVNRMNIGQDSEEFEVLISVLNNTHTSLTSSRRLNFPEYKQFQNSLNLGGNDSYDADNNY
jgi:hypothetical protein